MKEVVFTIDEEGNIKIDMIGFEGKGCGELADRLAKALGTITHREQKQEFYRPQQEQTTHIHRGM